MIQLNNEQILVIDELNKYINLKSEYSLFLLSGYAGTGKTTCISFFINQYIQNNKKVKKIGITAPTHKAVETLRKSINLENDKILKYVTIHSFLGLRPELDHTGKYILKQELNYKDLKEYDFIIIDECSMIDEIMFNYILKCSKKGLKIIFLGDELQIPPIGNLNCILFSKDIQLENKIKYFKLNEIVRQNENNPIIELSKYIRNNIQTNININDLINLFGDKIKFIDSINHTLIIELLLNKIKNINEDPNYFKCIAWTNNMVNNYNFIIRNLLYDNRINKNDCFIVDNIIFEIDKNGESNFNKPLLNTNDEIKILNYKIKQSNKLFNSNDTFKYYECIVEKLSLINKKKKKYRIGILHEDDINKFKDSIEHNRINIMKQRKEKLLLKTLWTNHFNLINNFASLKYNYCITSHKSQGSTYNSTLLLYHDIIKNQNIEERNRILYTAITRSSHELYIIY